MSSDKLVMSAKAILVKINAITGWRIEEDDSELLVEIFTKKLLASYSNVNADEMEFAFITEGTLVKDWGKNLNLSLIDEVMVPYLSKRRELSNIEEQKKIKNMLPPQKEDLSEKAMSDWWKDIERKVRTENYKVEFVPIALYDWMDKQGGIKETVKQKHEYVDKAAKYRLDYLTNQYAANSCEENDKLLTSFSKMYKEKTIEGKEVEIVKGIAKRMVVYNMMKSE